MAEEKCEFQMGNAAPEKLGRDELVGRTGVLEGWMEEAKPALLERRAKAWAIYAMCRLTKQLAQEGNNDLAQGCANAVNLIGRLEGRWAVTLDELLREEYPPFMDHFKEIQQVEELLDIVEESQRRKVNG